MALIFLEAQRRLGRVMCLVTLASGISVGSVPAFGAQEAGLDLPDPAAADRMAEVRAGAPAADPTRTSAHQDWSVFVERDSAGCWISSLPSRSRNIRGGKSVTVKRGRIALNVLALPDGSPEISFEAGYPLRPGSPVMLAIMDREFELKGGGEVAWAVGEGEDAAIFDLMRRAGSARISGVSSRGTRTEDSFSMMGVSQAFDEARKGCERP